MWRGVPRPVALPDTKAGLPATYVPSQGEIECVRAVAFTLTTGAGATPRQGSVTFLDPKGVPVAVCASPFTLAANKSQVVSLFVDGPQFGADDAANVGGPLYERWLDGHVTLEIGALGLVGTDVLSDIRLDVCGYPADWYDED